MSSLISCRQITFLVPQWHLQEESFSYTRLAEGLALSISPMPRAVLGITNERRDQCQKKVSKSHTPRTGLVISTTSHPCPLKTPNQKQTKRLNQSSSTSSFLAGLYIFFNHDQPWGKGEKDGVKITSCPRKSISSFHSNRDLAGT